MQNNFTSRCRDVLCFRKNYWPALERSQIVEIIRGESSFLLSFSLVSPLLLALFHEISSLGDAIAASEKHASQEIMRAVARNSVGERDVPCISLNLAKMLTRGDSRKRFLFKA